MAKSPLNQFTTPSGARPKAPLPPTPNTKKPPLTDLAPAPKRAGPAVPVAPPVMAPRMTPANKPFNPRAVSDLRTKLGSFVAPIVKPVVKAAVNTAKDFRETARRTTAEAPYVSISPAQAAKVKAENAARLGKQPASQPLRSKPRDTIRASQGGLRGIAAQKMDAKAQAPVTAPQTMMGEAARQGQTQPGSMMGEAARAGLQPQQQPLQAAVSPAGPPEAQSFQNPAAGPQAGTQGAMRQGPNVIPGYQPQQATETGLGDGYDGVYASEIARENARGAAFDGAQSELDMPTKSDFTQPWDKNDQAFGAEYSQRKQRMMDQFNQQLAALQGQYGAQQGAITGAQAGGQAGINQAVGAAGANVAGYGAPAAFTGQPIDQAQYLQGLGQAGAAQMQSLQSPGPAPSNLATSGLTPEVLAAVQAQHTNTLNANASSHQKAASENNNAALQRAYQAQGGTENDLLDIFGKTGTANTKGRTGSIADYYTANQGAVNERTKQLDKQYAPSSANDRALQDIASGGRNTADNLQSDQNNRRTTGASIFNNDNDNQTTLTTQGMKDLVSRANNGDTNATRLLAQGMSSEAAAERNAASITSREGIAANRLAAGGGTKGGGTFKPTLIKGDQYVATKLSKSPQTAALVRDIASKAQSARTAKKLPDGSANPMYGRSYDEILKAYWTAHPDQASTAKQHVGGYLNGEMYAAPKADAAMSGGGRGTGQRNADAANAFRAAKAKGWNVDGFNSSSAGHKATNPDSDHDTGRAFDLHETGPSARAKAAAIPGVRYFINQSTIYTKGANGQFFAAPYGGTFKKTGAPKDPHNNHVHVNF